jgi:uncharacterized protein YqfB (UPF0267 family)
MWKFIGSLVILASCDRYTVFNYNHAKMLCQSKVIVITDNLETEYPTCDYRSRVETIQNGKHFVVLCRCPTETSE